MATRSSVVTGPTFLTGNGTTASITWPSFPANSSVYVFVVESHNYTITPSGAPSTWQDFLSSGSGNSLGGAGSNGYIKNFSFRVNSAGQFSGTTTTITFGAAVRWVVGYLATNSASVHGIYGVTSSTSNSTTVTAPSEMAHFADSLPILVWAVAPVTVGVGATLTYDTATQTSLGQTTTSVAGVDNVAMGISYITTAPAGASLPTISAATASTAVWGATFVFYAAPSDAIVPFYYSVTDDVNPGVDPTGSAYTPVIQTGTAAVTISPTPASAGQIVINNIGTAATTISPTTAAQGTLFPISLRAATAVSFGTASALTFTLPAGVAQNDLLLGFYGGKDFGTTITSGTITTEYSLATSGNNGTTAAGNGTGSMYAAAYWKVHDGTEANPTGTLSATPNVAATAMVALRPTTPAGALWTVQGTFASSATATGTTYSVTGASVLPYKSGDWVVAQYVHNDDSSSNTAFTVSVPGCVVGAVTQVLTGTLTSALGGDMRMYVITAPIQSGTATGAPTISATVGTGDADGSSTILLARAPGDAANLQISPTTTATPAAITKTLAGLSTLVDDTTAASATATKPGVGSNTAVSPTVAAAGTLTEFGTANVTVSPQTNANPSGIFREISGSTKTFGTLNGGLGLGIIEHIGTATNTVVSPTTTSTPGAVAKPATGTSTLVDDTTTATAGAVTKSSAATTVTVSPIGTATAAGTAKSSTATNVTVSPTVTAVAQGTVKPATATSVTVSPTSAATAGAVTKPGSATSNTSPTPVSAGVVNDSGLASVSTTPTVAAAGFVTDATTANNVTVSPIPASAATKLVTESAVNVTVTPTTTSVPQPIVDTTSAIAVTVARTSTASGTTSKSTTSNLTTSPTPASAAFITDTEPAGPVTISPTSAATAGGTIKPGTANVTTTTPSTTSSGRVTDFGIATSSTSPTSSASGATTKSSAATAVTVSPTVVSAGVVNDEGTGSTSIGPSVSATAGATLKSSAATQVTQTPTTDADGVSDKDQTANNTQVTPTVTAAGFVRDTGTVSVAVTRTVAASGLRTVSGNAVLSSMATLTADPGLHPFFRSGNENDSGSSAGTVATVTIPADVQDGDMALVYLSKGNQTPYDTTPTGYTLLGTQNAGTEHQTSVWYKVLTTADASTVAQASWSTSSLWSMGVVVYGSVDSIIDGWSSISGGPGVSLTWDFTPSTHPETTAVLISGTRRVNAGGPYTHAFSEA